MALIPFGDLISKLTSNSSLDDERDLMRNKADALDARADDIIKEIGNAEVHPGKKRRREVDHWLNTALELRTRVLCIEKEVEDGASSLRRLRYKIVKITKEIEQQLEQAKFHNGLMIDDLTSSSFPLVTTEMKGQLFEQNLRMIISWLMTDEFFNIGVYGVGGVGKTTLATHIHDQIRNAPVKYAGVYVYWITVSKDCSLSHLQQKIAEELKISDFFDKADEVRKPAIISETLKKRGRTMLILDDLWDYFPLQKLGLPISKSHCKLLLTTRSLDICRRMSCQKSVKLAPLSVQDSWSLFTETLGNFVDLPREVQDIAKLVAKECAGLPLAIVVVAASMRGVIDVYEWSNTLDELTKSTRIHEGMENEVFSSLEVSYSRLKDEKLQNCFLSCALYPQDFCFSRNEIIDLWIKEGHLEDIKSWHEQLNMAHTMLNRLVNACLLDLTQRDMKMHDLVSDMAIGIARQKHHVMIKAGEQLREVPCIQEWTGELTKMSLMKNKIERIPSGMNPSCPHLSTLLLNWNPLTVIPDSFFMYLKGLKLLDLSHTYITKVPNSISYLENISALNLHGCFSLIHAPSVVMLTKLRHLDLSSCTKIQGLPQGMEKLIKLQHLNLIDSDNLCVQFSELISGLSQLQCLEVGHSIKGILDSDLIKLEGLERLFCHIQDTTVLKKYLKSENFLRLKSYEIMLTTSTDEFSKYTGVPQRPRYTHLLLNQRKITIYNFPLGNASVIETPLLPHDLKELDVESCNLCVGSLNNALPSLRSLISLKSLRIFDCKGLECIWSPSSNEDDDIACIDLEYLILMNLHGFRALANGEVQFPLRAFSCLESLNVYHCHNLTKLFIPCMLKGDLCSLQQISISGCHVLEEIFAEDDYTEDDESVTVKQKESLMIMELPRLSVLSLNDLPKLARICKTGLLCKSIETIIVTDCPKLKTLPLVLELHVDGMPIAPPSLREINVEENWWESLEWDNPHIKYALQPFVQFSLI